MLESYAVHCIALNPACDVQVTTETYTMKQSVNFSAFVDAFHAHNRYDQFGYQALRVIFDYMEEYEDSTGKDIELDVIAICCDYKTEHYKDIADNYNIDLSDADGDEDAEKQIVLDHLNYNTMVLGETDCEIVYQCF
jgi:hypothetical protein